MTNYTDTLAGEIVSLEQKVKTPSPMLRQVVGENVVSFVGASMVGTMVGYYQKKTGLEYDVSRTVFPATTSVVIKDVGTYFHVYNRDLSKTIRDNIGALAGLVIGMYIGYHL